MDTPPPPPWPPLHRRDGGILPLRPGGCERLRREGEDAVGLGVAGATRTPTPTKTMPSAITGPLPIGPPTWKVKSGDPVLASRAL